MNWSYYISEFINSPLSLISGKWNKLKFTKRNFKICFKLNKFVSFCFHLMGIGIKVTYNSSKVHRNF